MEAAGSSEILVTTHETTRCHTKLHFINFLIMNLKVLAYKRQAEVPIHHLR
jgi:hypothetical protein